ncbi:hypothetical protein LSH36_21g08014 [Paralvinella palmiformis]|uniref:Uncharacterized protein n=1 Tax=Paralvinella palmiformis TaxID=53620 RepID=A0AAD9NI63_9ANNE|nr:hypothetical protein LSH36_21g08014 [Paralvinella palmiformis]
MQAVDLFGKLLYGPWVHRFYTSSESEISHVDAIGEIRGVLRGLRERISDPMSLFRMKVDLFGRDLNSSDRTLILLRELPLEDRIKLFTQMMKAILQSTAQVLERQYRKYFDLTITNKLREETLSPRSHNIDAEKVTGMFSALLDRAPHATVGYLRSKKNRSMEYLDNLSHGQREHVIQFVIPVARNRKK